MKYLPKFHLLTNANILLQFCRSLFNKDILESSPSTSNNQQSTSSTSNPFYPQTSSSVHHNNHHEPSHHENVDFDLSPLNMGYSPSTSGTSHHQNGHNFKTEDDICKSEMPLIDLNSEDFSPIVGRFNFNQQTDSSSLGKDFIVFYIWKLCFDIICL